jgi:hypothetical protein
MGQARRGDGRNEAAGFKFELNVEEGLGGTGRERGTGVRLRVRISVLWRVLVAVRKRKYCTYVIDYELLHTE